MEIIRVILLRFNPNPGLGILNVKVRYPRVLRVIWCKVIVAKALE